MFLKHLLLLANKQAVQIPSAIHSRITHPVILLCNTSRQHQKESCLQLTWNLLNATITNSNNHHPRNATLALYYVVMPFEDKERY